MKASAVFLGSIAIVASLSWVIEPVALATKDAHSHNDPHKHGTKAEPENGDHGHEDAEEEHHKEGGHAHGEEEGSSSVGPNKGILAASEDQGFKLSEQALKNFEVKTVRLVGSDPWVIPTSAQLNAREEVNIYRLRSGFFRRIDFSVSKRAGSQMSVTSKDLAAGDEVVIGGVGFLRIAELAAFGGAPEGHSH